MTTASRRNRNVAGVVAVLVLLALALASRANGSVYWGNSIGPGSDAVARANNDGTGVDQSFITGINAPCGVAVDGTHIYWTNSEGTIGRANLDGTGVDQSFITDINAPCGVAVDGTHIYWTDLAFDGGSDRIGRANLDGSGVNEEFISGADSPVAVAVDQAHLYWANNGNLQTIARANLDGTGVDQNFIDGGGLPCGVAVDSAHIYWTSFSTTDIGRANLDGTGVDPSFVDGGDFLPCGVAVDSAHIWWTSANTNADDPAGDAIGRANIDGSGANPTFTTGVHVTGGLAADIASQAEQAAQISVDDVVAVEGDSGQTAFRFNVSLDNAESAAVTVDFATTDGTATPSDYAAGRGTVNFAPGDTSKTVTVQVNGDTTVEPNETFTLNLANASDSATITDGQGVGTIVNDDQAPPAPPAPPVSTSGGKPSSSPGGQAVGPTAAGGAGAQRRFALGKLQLNRKTGTARLAVTVPGPGKVAISGSGVRAAHDRRINAAGTVQVAVAVRGKKQKALNRTHKITVRVKVTYTPIGGTPSSLSKSVSLRKR
jgi:hypothetical protein